MFKWTLNTKSSFFTVFCWKDVTSTMTLHRCSCALYQCHVPAWSCQGSVESTDFHQSVGIQKREYNDGLVFYVPFNIIKNMMKGRQTQFIKLYVRSLVETYKRDHIHDQSSKPFQLQSQFPLRGCLPLTFPFPASILHKSIAGRYRPVRVADGPITARYRFM